MAAENALKHEAYSYLQTGERPGTAYVVRDLDDFTAFIKILLGKVHRGQALRITVQEAV